MALPVHAVHLYLPASQLGHVVQVLLYTTPLQYAERYWPYRQLPQDWHVTLGSSAVHVLVTNCPTWHVLHGPHWWVSWACVPSQRAM